MSNSTGQTNFTSHYYDSCMVTTGQPMAFASATVTGLVAQPTTQSFSFTSESPFFSPQSMNSSTAVFPSGSSTLSASFSFTSSTPSSSSSCSSASPILNSFSSTDSSGFSSGLSSCNSSVFSSPVPVSRIQLYKNHQYVKESPANQLKLRRHSTVAKFRRIDLIEKTGNSSEDDDEYDHLPPLEYDPAWSFSAVCDADEWANAMDSTEVHQMEW